MIRGETTEKEAQAEQRQAKSKLFDRIPKKPLCAALIIAAAASFVYAAVIFSLTPTDRIALEESAAVQRMETLGETETNNENGSSEENYENEKKYIKWVDFKVTFDALQHAMKLDIENHSSETPMPWVDMLSVLACMYGGEFSRYREKDMDALAERVKTGESLEDIASGMKYFSYFREAYGAVLGGMIGEYDIQIPSEDDPSVVRWERRYGLKVFFPLAKGYDYSHYDDFGDSRSYGYKREHLGHDILGAVGTPVVAVESGTVEAIGWNRFGGWRIGIRSFDRKRYYYYAHLRKGHPYAPDLKEGDTVMAGDVIGYLGRTGYSTKEDTNNISTPHLHFGMELIFDESQKDGVTQIWIDLYSITKLLSANRVEVIRDSETKDWYRRYAFSEDIPEIPDISGQKTE